MIRTFVDTHIGYLEYEVKDMVSKIADNQINLEEVLIQYTTYFLRFMWTYVVIPLTVILMWVMFTCFDKAVEFVKDQGGFIGIYDKFVNTVDYLIDLATNSEKRGAINLGKELRSLATVEKLKGESAKDTAPCIKYFEDDEFELDPEVTERPLG